MNLLQKHHLPFIVLAILLLLALPFFGLDFTYSGNTLRHFAMETIGGFVALIGAAAAYNNTIGKRSIILPYIAAALLGAGLIDIFHATLSVDYFNVVTSKNIYFIPATWTAGRILLTVLIFAGILNYKLYRHVKINTIILMLFTVLLSFLLVYVMSTVELPAFILENATIHRPWETVPIVFSVLSIIVVHKYRATIPAILYAYGFFILSIITQATMLFSLELYSPLFDVSHLLKIFSYLYVTTPMVILLQKRSNKSLAINVGRTQSRALLSIVAGIIILLNFYAHYTLQEKRTLEDLQELRSALCLSKNVFNAHKHFPDTISKKSTYAKKPLSYKPYTCNYSHYSRIADEHNVDLNYQTTYYYSLLDDIILAYENNEICLYKELYSGLTNFIANDIKPELQNIIDHESDSVMSSIVEDKRDMMLLIWIFFMAVLILSPFMYVYNTTFLNIQFAPLIFLTDHIASISDTGSIKPISETATTDEINTLTKTFNKMAESINKSREVALTAEQTLQMKLDERTATLASTTDHLQRVVDNVGDAVFTSNTKGEIESVNRAGLELFGYELNDLLGKNVKILQPENLAVKHDDILKRYRETGKGRLMGQAATEATAKRKNGEIFPIEIAITETKKGDDHTFIALIKDITLRKNAEKTFAKNKERMVKFLDSTTEGLFHHKDGILVDINKNGLKMLGLSMEEIKGHQISEYLDSSYVKGILGRSYEYKLKRKGGQELHIALADRNITIDNNTYSVISIRDIGDIKDAKKETEQVEAELQTLIDTANAPIFGIDTEGRVTEWNQSAEKITYYSKEEVYGHDLVAEFITEEYRVSVDEVLKNALKGKETSNYEFPLYTRDGSHRLVLLNATPRRDMDGNITGVIGIGQDITEIDESRKKLAKERSSLEFNVASRTKELQNSLVRLEDSNLQLEKINRHKDEFISNMSHELRTPLNGIIGTADLLHDQLFGALNNKQLSYTNQITKSADHLLSLINDLLDMAKIDSGSMELTVEKVAIKEWIENTVGIMQTQFRKKDIKTHIDISTSHGYLMADARKCKQIVLNLLSNAAKYSPEGSDIFIRIFDVGSDHIMTEVEDSGIGIKEENFDRIFHEFYQVDRRRDEMLGGTGIGLALTKRLVEMHGGKIKAKNSKNGGALISFLLPTKSKESDPSSDTKVMTCDDSLLSLDLSQQKKILIAEDNKVNASILLDMLSEFNYRTAVVENGQMALDMIQSCKPDLVLMDMKMPVMGGLEATKKIREIPEFADLPIIAITASVTEVSKKEQLEAGCTDHISKPLKRKNLLRVIEKHLRLGNQ